jgi:hypothetical protein
LKKSLVMKIGCKQNKILKRVGEGEEGGEEGVLSFLDQVRPCCTWY